MMNTNDKFEERVAALEEKVTPTVSPPSDAMITVFRKTKDSGVWERTAMHPIDLREAESHNPGEWTSETPPPSAKIVDQTKAPPMGHVEQSERKEIWAGGIAPEPNKPAAHPEQPITQPAHADEAKPRK